MINKFFNLILILLVGCSSHEQKPPKLYLALGDSYTIGESVEVFERWPNQLVSELNKNSIVFEQAKIIAKTGWTTGELLNAIEEQQIDESYDLVSLMIGVNNQYRGLSIENFKEEFTVLLKKAITFSKKNETGVVVLSIPDWGVTPFASDRDQNKIAEEIDQFNSVISQVCSNYKVSYIDVTEISRQVTSQPNLVAQDGLHPSSIMYSLWIKKVLNYITN
ncbi:SGNH/GDSL hydrolase family protein [Flavobacteriaceae bacterium]|uniref:SGNH/GDSL hydrolase family protein n=1 Tax=Candidatus Arcticimaribacter forsetii TaxID=2820661 RepID=UPI00207798CC|nr:SGNH/GDSL hydrolase family protein [Candidatus Arcticimaribacter forsetii]MDB2329854.1 SGNH/GDSL hydrolase family protein [Flavobacteriaceae bacterium]MDB2456846.1 SGNH/GDSL hydrolase family protein [Flavobacteriaceae bacterium]MDB4738309.1 SGNH/GDSL hydrolase family protein [Flavobacteriaceae bacterium]MDC0959878.1 SGNH/GDSL hydrolase family protein [Flavobacteriaceae bacterium]